MVYPGCMATQQGQAGEAHVVERTHGKGEAAGSSPAPGSKRSTKRVGDIAEAMVLARYIRAGQHVSIPFGENHRYDFVADDGTALVRVQVKSGRLRKGAIVFNTCSMHDHRGGPAQGYRGQIEVFAVYCPETDGVYVVPVDSVPERSASLRLLPAKNGMTTGVRMAEEFLLR